MLDFSYMIALCYMLSSVVTSLFLITPPPIMHCVLFQMLICCSVPYFSRGLSLIFYDLYTVLYENVIPIIVIVSLTVCFMQVNSITLGVLCALLDIGYL